MPVSLFTLVILNSNTELPEANSNPGESVKSAATVTPVSPCPPLEYVWPLGETGPSINRAPVWVLNISFSA